MNRLCYEAVTAQAVWSILVLLLYKKLVQKKAYHIPAL